MRSLAACLFCLVVFPGGALPAQQEPAPSHVLIIVTEPTGIGVAHARVRVVPAPGHASGKTETDSEGNLSLDLKPGGYALFVTCAGFASVATHIEVRPGETQTIPVALQIAPTSPPVKVLPPSEKDSLLVSAYPYHDDVWLKPADFQALPHTRLTVREAHSNAEETYSGVPLADLLAKYGAPLGKELHGIALASYIIATGSDGYQAVFSLAEVDPSFHPGDVIVADSLNGRPLDAKAGPFKLVVSEDKRPARSVRNLISLQLKSAP